MVRVAPQMFLSLGCFGPAGCSGAPAVTPLLIRDGRLAYAVARNRLSGSRSVSPRPFKEGKGPALCCCEIAEERAAARGARTSPRRIAPFESKVPFPRW